MSLLIFVTVPCTALFGGFKTNHEIPAMKIQNIPAISGLYIFSYAGHIVSLIYMQQLKDPSMFTKVKFFYLFKLKAFTYIGSSLISPITFSLTITFLIQYFIIKEKKVK